MFKNLKIRTKVLAAFGTIIFLAACIVVGLLIKMDSIAETTQELYEKPYAATDNMWNIRRNILDTKSVLYKLVGVSSGDKAAESQEVKATFDQDVASIQQSLDALDAMFTSPDKKQMLAEVREDVTTAAAAWEEVYDLASGGRGTEAMDALDSTYEPLVNDLNSAVLELAAIVSQDAASFAEEARLSSNASILTGVIFLLAGTVLAIVIAMGFAKSVVSPLIQLDSAAKEMSKGNMKAAQYITYKSKDELGLLADSLRITMNNLEAYVSEISSILLKLSKGDLTVPRDEITDFLGDFSEIKTSFVTILKSFNITLGDIHESSAQVDSSASQVSDAAQMLSQGATEQATALEDLTGAVSEISDQIKENAENAQNANQLTQKVQKEVEESNNHMLDMNTAMSEISNSSQEIGKIIKAIEDIAFQTNILALNAAVEAARAGEAGKGFAVVADEVRNLASKSAEASKDTAALIVNSVKAVENGMTIAEETSRSLEIVNSTTMEVVETVNRIAKASAKQAVSAENVSQRVNQISAVVQTNSATAEESAAASEELSGQAAYLDNLVGRFQLFHG